jgi:hypothetical protein
MPSLIKISVRGEFLPQLFVRFGRSNQPLHYPLNTMLKEEGQYRSPSIIGMLDDRRILKLIKPRRILECVKLMYGRSRISKEVRGNKVLQAMGIGVPLIDECAYGFLPAKGYDFVGYYIMENLIDKGMQDLSVLFADEQLLAEQRRKIIKNLITDLQKMRDNYVVFSDLTLGNVFSNNNAELVWIDTGITEYSAHKQQKFELKYNFSLDRFMDIHKNTLSEEEKAQIAALKF